VVQAGVAVHASLTASPRSHPQPMQQVQFQRLATAPAAVQAVPGASAAVRAAPGPQVVAVAAQPTEACMVPTSSLKTRPGMGGSPKAAGVTFGQRVSIDGNGQMGVARPTVRGFASVPLEHRGNSMQPPAGPGVRFESFGQVMAENNNGSMPVRVAMAAPGPVAAQAAFQEPPREAAVPRAFAPRHSVVLSRETVSRLSMKSVPTDASEWWQDDTIDEEQMRAAAKMAKQLQIRKRNGRR